MKTTVRFGKDDDDGAFIAILEDDFVARFSSTDKTPSVLNEQLCRSWGHAHSSNTCGKYYSHTTPDAIPSLKQLVIAEVKHAMKWLKEQEGEYCVDNDTREIGDCAEVEV